VVEPCIEISGLLRKNMREMVGDKKEEI